MKFSQLDRQKIISILAPVFLFVLNIYICWELLFVEYLPHFVSIEPLFFAIARAIRHGTHIGWWPQWYCGMPFAYTYQPLLHYTTAGVSVLTGLSVGRALHAVLAIGYALGPVTVYALTLRLSRRVDVGMTAGLLYSLWSPAALLMPEMAASVSGKWNPLRLNSPVVYADSPYVFGLTLLPLAVVALDRAIAQRTPLRWIVAGLALVSVLLTNIPAFISLTMALTAYGLAADRGSRARTWIAILAASIIGYVLAAILLPPSGLLLNFSNAQWMDQAGRFSNHVLAYSIVGSILLLVAYGLARLRLQRFVRFGVLFALLTMAIVLGYSWFRVTLLAQAGRFHLVMEMALIMAISSIAVPFVTRWRAGRLFLAAGLVVFCAIQTANYRAYAVQIIKPAAITTRSEYKIARWLDQNAHGDRAFVPGSVSFWLNALTDTPQMLGCCDQNTLFQAPRIAYYVLTNDPQPDLSLACLRALGVRYVAICGPDSTEHYKATRYPNKFDNVLPLRWREGDDSIFEVPARSHSLAHVVKRTELLQTSATDVATLQHYVAAIESPRRPNATFTWEDRNTARIEAQVHRGELISVQIAYHAGWKAVSSGRPARISHDALGLMAIESDCDGPCSISLMYTGGVEALVLKLLTVVAWISALSVVVISRIGKRLKRVSNARDRRAVATAAPAL